MSKRRFFPILDPLKMGWAGLCSWRRFSATRIKRPQQNERFFVFFGAGVGGSAPASHTELYIVALGRSWGKPLVWSRRNRIYDPLPSSRTYRRPSKPMRRPIRRPAIYALACDPRKSGAGKRNAKIIRCFCKLILDRF